MQPQDLERIDHTRGRRRLRSGADRSDVPYANTTVGASLVRMELVAFGERLATATERARGRVWNDVFGEMDPSPTEPSG